MKTRCHWNQLAVNLAKNKHLKAKTIIKNFARVLLSILVTTSYAIAQESEMKITSEKQKGFFYLLWGYNRDWYAKSNIRFRNIGDPNQRNSTGNYDFTIYNAVAHDRPDFDRIKDVVNFTGPQFNFRIGYYFNNKRDQGIEISYDHAKYVVDDWQTVRITGQIFGSYIDKDSILNCLWKCFIIAIGKN